MFMMSSALFVVLLAVLGVIFVVATSRRLPSGGDGATDRRLAEQTERLLSQQAERISQLEDELERLKEQADFTEKLLSERSSAPPEEEQPGKPSGP